MRPVPFEDLERVLGQHPFDLDLVFGDLDGENERLYRFPPEGYEPRRVAWDCFNDLLETRGCEAEMVDPQQRLWALTYVCPKHDAETRK
jgi:hypothetical protein